MAVTEKADTEQLRAEGQRARGDVAQSVEAARRTAQKIRETVDRLEELAEELRTRSENHARAHRRFRTIDRELSEAVGQKGRRVLPSPDYGPSLPRALGFHPNVAVDIETFVGHMMRRTA